jgi:hypothetical protein
VEAGGRRWDTGIARACAFPGRPARGARCARRLAVAVLLLAPSTLLQLGLRDATAPWFHTNDSTYQIELAGELLLDGRSPYGHDYRFSGLERFYTRDGTASTRVREREVALRHYAYFPGSALTAAPWRLLPAPWDDYRLLVLRPRRGHARGRRAGEGPLARIVAGGARVRGGNPARGAGCG